MCLNFSTKACRRCGQEKPFSEYHKATRGVFGLCAYCKPCRREYEREYEANKKAQRPPFSKVTPCPDCGKFSFTASNKKTQRCKSCAILATKELNRIYAEKKRRKKGVKPVKGVLLNCAICGSNYIMKTIHNKYCSDKCRVKGSAILARDARQKILLENGGSIIGQKITCKNCYCEFIKKAGKEIYCTSCKEKQKKSALPIDRLRIKNRKKNDPLFSISDRVRSLVRSAFRRNGYKKNSKTQEILGCDFEFFKKHIERQFTKGMAWNRKSEIHIDHIIPLAMAKTEDDVIKLNHFTNLRPMWAKDNLAKGDNMTHLI